MENVETTMSIDELDTINYKENGVDYLYTSQLINEEIQVEVDRKINKWIKEGKAILLRGVLIIEDCEKLPLEIIQKIQNFSTFSYCPLLFLIFNESKSKTFDKGISLNFNFYTENEISEIIKRMTGVSNESEIEILNKMAKANGLAFAYKFMNSVEYPFSQSSLKKITNLFDF